MFKNYLFDLPLYVSRIFTCHVGKVQISELLEGGKKTTQKDELKRQMIRDLRSEKISVIQPELNTHEKNKVKTELDTQKKEQGKNPNLTFTRKTR